MPRKTIMTNIAYDTQRRCYYATLYGGGKSGRRVRCYPTLEQAVQALEEFQAGRCLERGRPGPDHMYDHRCITSRKSMRAGAAECGNLWEMPLHGRGQQNAVTHQVCNGFFVGGGPGRARSAALCGKSRRKRRKQ